MALGLAVVYVPLLVVLANSFNARKTFGWPPQSVHPALVAPHASTTRASATALWTSVKVGLGATAIALVLGTMAAFAVSRYRFFGRDAVSFLVILPIALPGIVTGIALNSAFTPAACSLRLPHRRRRPRDLLHRRGLQQRAGPAAPYGHHLEEASHGPRRDVVPDVPPW